MVVASRGIEDDCPIASTTVFAPADWRGLSPVDVAIGDTLTNYHPGFFALNTPHRTRFRPFFSLRLCLSYSTHATVTSDTIVTIRMQTLPIGWFGVRPYWAQIKVDQSYAV